jgi:signal transduction histidine kinase
MINEFHRVPSEHLADEDLAHRSRLSGLVYLTLYGIIIVFTPYAHDHTAIAVLVSAIVFFSAALRSWLVFRFDDFYTPVPGRWLKWFTVFTLLLGGTWGLFCAHAILHYSLEWTAMLALLSTAGISAGAITTLSIRRGLVMAFLALLLLPPTATAAFIHTRESYAITLMFLTYCVFMFGVANRINKEYWKALNNTLLLDQRARELEASNQELESYSYSIAHDLRTPLRSIIGFSQILKEDLQHKMAPSEQDDLERVINAGKHMATLIDDILDLSRITRRNMEDSDTDLSKLALAHADSLIKKEPERSVKLKIDSNLHARGDSHLLSIALQKMIDNAWKFTRNKDHAEIVFSSANKDNETVYYLCDNGVGFDMAHAGKLFKPFQRLHNQAEFPGTGTGLAMVQRIILRHGGQIWVESTLGKGACFYFTLQ